MAPFSICCGVCCGTSIVLDYIVYCDTRLLHYDITTTAVDLRPRGQHRESELALMHNCLLVLSAATTAH
jgi:hypothetical protein